jgi:hypothetical protein
MKIWKKQIFSLVVAVLAIFTVVFIGCPTSADGTNSGGTNSGTNSGGTNSGTNKYKIGDIGPGGGKIFYYSEAGFIMTDNNQLCHYLEVAPSDIGSTLAWQPSYGYTDVAGTEKSIGTGRKNTTLIRTNHQSSNEDFAAKACNNYRGPNNLTDWFLPSLEELKQLYTNRISTNKPSISVHYWSSSQLMFNYVYIIYSYDGQESNDFKNTLNKVWPVRAF